LGNLIIAAGGCQIPPEPIAVVIKWRKVEKKFSFREIFFLLDFTGLKDP